MAVARRGERPSFADYSDCFEGLEAEVVVHAVGEVMEIRDCCRFGRFALIAGALADLLRGMGFATG